MRLGLTEGVNEVREGSLWWVVITLGVGCEYTRGASLTGMMCVPVGTTTLGGGVWDTLGGGADCNGGNDAWVIGGGGGATCTLGGGARVMG